MQKPLITVVALLLSCPAALAHDMQLRPPGPPIEQIATDLGLTEQQASELKRIFAEEHRRMEAQRKESMQRVDTELAGVLTPEQLAQFRQQMHEDRPHRRGPPPCPAPSGD